MDSALEEAHIRRTDINQLLLTGHATQILGIQSFLEQQLGISATHAREVDPEYAVAIGVAMVAAILTNDDSCLGCMMDVAGRNIGMITPCLKFIFNLSARY